MKRKQPTKSSILRAVASSTAIATGQPVKTIEALLKTKNSQFRHLKLAQ